jgi:hypothetical protein
MQNFSNRLNGRQQSAFSPQPAGLEMSRRKLIADG